MAAAPECLRAVGLQFWARSKDDSQRLLESFTCNEKEHPLPESEAEPYTSKEEMVLEENESPLNSNVTAFALKAKVIYPINQKFRPLADGSSNPSLHENPKQGVLPNQVTEASTSGSLESLSHGDKEDCSSSTTIHSTTSDDRFQDRAFFKVACFPEVLTCESFDVKLCLCSLVLKDLMLLDTELRKEECVIFIQILKTYLTEFNHKKKITDDLFKKIFLILKNIFIQILKTYLTEFNHKKKITDDLFKKIFLILKNDFEELQKQLDSRLQNTEMSGAHNSDYQTVEDLERKEREYSEHIIDNDIQERLFNWELIVKMLDSLKSRIPEECRCRLNILSNILDNLTVKNKLSVRQKEELLTDLHKAFWEQLAHFTNGNEPLLDLPKAGRRGLVVVLRVGVCFTNTYAKALPVKAYHDLLEKHWQAQWQLEEEDDCESTEAVVELYKDLYSKASHTLAELVNELFLQTLPVVTGLSVRECELLKEDWQDNVIPQLEKWDSHHQKRWKLFQEQLLQEKKYFGITVVDDWWMMGRKVMWNVRADNTKKYRCRGKTMAQLWINEYALSSVMQKHLSEKQEKIMQGVMSRLGCLSDESVNYILQKQRLLMCSVWRRLTLRGIGMAALTRMRMSRKKSLLQELREQHILQKSSSACQDEDQWQLQKAVEKLVEAAVESVYGTSNNISRLVENYYQQVGKITEVYEGKKLQQLKSFRAERSERYRLRKKEVNDQALKEKQTKGILSVSSTVHQRWRLFNFLTSVCLSSQPMRKVRPKCHVCEAEWDFVTELAALARVPVTVKKQLSKRSKPAEEKTNSKRGTLKSPKSEDKDDSCENIQESLELNSSSCRYSRG
ncbi:hypothetical protein ASZ78_011428 [Callipepla squamata]|uniref:Uncharacterized protein n=1 Tax=Callipepla squamata TaxID=9009 RepID=A0A226MLW5_CALSU|nr:hypothetical protein ASZ78_011428 [Callipepla squamata]